MNEKSNFGKIKYKDIIHTYTSGERIGYNTTLNTPHRFYTTDEYQELEQQLQSYKDKEKEIRRICKAQKRVANTFIKAEKDFIYHNTIGEDILQILNEGVKE